MYDFHDLSPLDFEELVRDLLQAELKVRMESFGPGKDKGIDARFAVAAGRTVVQAKHYIRSGRAKLLATLKAENKKVAALKPKRYILATSVSLTPGYKDKILAAMPDAPLVTDDVIGQEDLNNLLGRHPEIEKKHFKLWLGSTSVLERILHSGIYNRSETELGIIQRLIPKFVQNASVDAAETILSSSGTLIISGHPGVGKTTLARILVWLHAAQDWEIFVVDDIREAFEVAASKEKRLIFFDDFLGQVRLSSDHVRGLDQRLPPFLERIKSNKNLRFVLTTREYILSQAGLISRRLASREVLSNKYVLNVGIYTRAVKARILYNHLYFSGLSAPQIDAILKDDFYLKIIDHPNFNPRLIELLTSEEYATLSGGNLRSAISRVLDNPDELWERPYRDHISEDGRAMMMALLLQRGPAPFRMLQSAFERMATALGHPIPGAESQPRFAAALKELEGSVLAIVDRNASFSNPGVRDFLQAVVIKDDLFRSLATHVERYVELQQLWTIFYDRNPRPTATASDAELWSDAIRRIHDSDQGDLLDRLELSLGIFDHFSDEASLTVVREIIDQIESEGLYNSVRASISALENSSLHALSIADQDRLVEVLTVAIGNMLRSSANEMPLEDIEALDEALSLYGSDPGIAEDAVRDALAKFIPDIDDEISEIRTIDELDDFEKRLNRLITKRNYVGQSASSDLRRRRERIEESEYEWDDDSYSRSSTPFPGPTEATNADIKSMFSELSSSRSDSER